MATNMVNSIPPSRFRNEELVTARDYEFDAKVRFRSEGVRDRPSARTGCIEVGQHAISSCYRCVCHGSAPPAERDRGDIELRLSYADTLMTQLTGNYDIVLYYSRQTPESAASSLLAPPAGSAPDIASALREQLSLDWNCKREPLP